MSSDKKTPIIKKIIKKGHGGHHGGSWKVAYADFVTAMMAFFLVMWLLAISSEQGKAALAEYYNELTLTEAIANGGLLTPVEGAPPKPSILTGGCFELTKMGEELEEREKALDEREKALTDRRDERPDLGATRPTDRPQDPNLTELPEGQEGGEGSTQTGVAPGDGPVEDVPPGPGMGQAGTADQARQAKSQFAADLISAASDSLGGADLGGQLSVEIVPGGLRIQLMDKEGRPMFVSGQPKLTPLAQLLLASVAERLSTIPNKLAIEGHTDAVVTLSQTLTNWELSTARASAARRFLSTRGVKDERLTMVAGYAATKTLPGTDPTDPINRRVTLMIYDVAAPEAPPAPPAEADQVRQAPPSAGASSEAAGPPPARRPGRQRLEPTRPSQESLEQMLLEQTLKNAAAPDASTAGPPLERDPAE
ncbi:MAG: OmpA family protein [Deltaproteobacteria bacterium]|jgi:chemotaxis protein MotB|nr:OmpA family protein [Deltaproteobacteria bacterium]